MDKIKEFFKLMFNKAYRDTDKIFKIEPKIILNAWEHRIWGNAISFDSQNKDGSHNISGHLQQRLHIGDEVRYEIDGGFILGKITEIKWMRDPTDMFFAKLAG